MKGLLAIPFPEVSYWAKIHHAGLFPNGHSPNVEAFPELNIHKWGVISSLVAHCLLVPGDHGSNPSGKKKFPFSFLNCDLMVAIYHGINS